MATYFANSGYARRRHLPHTSDLTIESDEFQNLIYVCLNMTKTVTHSLGRLVRTLRILFHAQAYQQINCMLEHKNMNVWLIQTHLINMTRERALYELVISSFEVANARRIVLQYCTRLVQASGAHSGEC